MIGIDAQVLVRYLAQDDAVQSAAATRFVEGSLGNHRRGHVSLVTLAELNWVMRSRYRVGREAMSEALLRIMADSRFVIQDADAAWAALDAYRSLGVDFADALIAAVDRLHGCERTVTFDKDAARLENVELLS